MTIKRSTSILCFLCTAFLLILVAFCCGAHHISNAYAKTQKEVSTLEELKSALADKSGPQTISIAKDITISEELHVPSGADVTLVAPQPAKLIMDVANNDANVVGRSMLTVDKGATLTIGDSTANLYFDGNNAVTNTSLMGVLLTVEGTATIKNGEFANVDNKGVSGAPIYVKGGSLTVDNIHLHDNKYSWQQTTSNVSLWSKLEYWQAISGGIVAADGATVVINDGIFENCAYDKAIEHMSFPAVLSVNKDSKLTINGGTFKNNTGLYGGVLYVSYKGSAVINGGTFTGNKAFNCGGVVCQDFASTLEVKGGTFSGNSSKYGGALVVNDRYREATGDDGGSKISNLASSNGITSLDQWKRYGFEPKLTISGGAFDNNRATIAGGALFISCDDAQITAGTFTNNQAVRFGGALYLSTAPFKLKLSNVYVGKNNVDKLDRIIDYNHDGQQIPLYPGSGGGVWYCPTGDSEVHISNGVAFGDNKAVHDGDDFASVIKRHKVDNPDVNDPDQNKDFFITVKDRMLGGGKVDWYKDGSAVSDGADRYKEGDAPIEPISKSQDAVSLKAISKYDALTLAHRLATVVFENNKASRGGAIATNGTVIFGDKDQEFDITLKKKWSDEIDTGSVAAEKVAISLYNTTDAAHPALIDKIELSAENNWEYTIKNLPLQAGNKAITYKLTEEGAAERGYSVDVAVSGSGASVVTDENGSPVAQVNTADVAAGSKDTVVTFTNSPVPPVTPPTPPETPTPPSTPPVTPPETPSAPPVPPATPPVSYERLPYYLPKTSDTSGLSNLAAGCGFAAILCAGAAAALGLRNRRG